MSVCYGSKKFRYPAKGEVSPKPEKPVILKVKSKVPLDLLTIYGGLTKTVFFIGQFVAVYILVYRGALMLMSEKNAVPEIPPEYTETETFSPEEGDEEETAPVL